MKVPPVSQCPVIKGERFRTRKCDYFDVLDQGGEECEGAWLEFEVCEIECEGGGVKAPKYRVFSQSCRERGRKQLKKG